MFKLIVLAAFVAVATAKPGHLSPLFSTLVQEKTIESHGNSVVHPSATVVHSVPVVPAVPVVQTTYVEPARKVVYQPVSTLVSEKTVSNHGHSIVHGAPLVHSVHTAYVAPTYTYHL